ncbi:unnamed protein product [Penicillium salamii]|uniref:Uncharacterized protein n=1 Tax=Penicillium salamii TaxID=1612424 RepID=A0A9W4J9D3_9EURO|nr:unnamed protein product [Penicillium salamii]CAG8009341.1 unnamed protein product [Penicillium salamii]CAG8016816.1 unnamed protein product [Penicillium salamii]CAG8092880.1 unnamed protein product [Penicillium salamii]CAG8317866.1 unnamed protein product [Penicillium salamii]
MAPRPRRPRPKISLWARFRWWLRFCHSPLRLRGSYRRLSHHNRYPLLKLLRMFIPYPTWYFPIEGPFPLRPLIEDTQNKTNIINSHFGDIHNLRDVPIWRWRDTPLRSIYRLYELHLADKYALIGWETEYFFFRPDWKLVDIPDPKDPDPIRYAILASITEEILDAFNWRLSLGLRRNGEKVLREDEGDPWPPFTPEELPNWTAKVAPIDKGQLKQTVPPGSLDADGNLVLEERGKSLNFRKRNIITNSGWLYTI